VVEGVISNIVDFGAFVDLDGIDGLIHISELSWSHVNHPSELLEIGQKVRVKVLDIDRDRQRISLGLKQTQADPWQQVLDAYQQGDVVRGRVTKVVTFGAFVEIVPGVEGLVHISELAAHHVENPREVVTQGDDTPVKIIEVDADRRRLSLSIKRVEPEDEILASIELEGLPPRRESLPADADAEDDERFTAAAEALGETETADEAAAEEGESEDVAAGAEDEPEPEAEAEAEPEAEAAEPVELDEAPTAEVEAAAEAPAAEVEAAAEAPAAEPESEATIEDPITEPQPEGIEDADAVGETPEEEAAEATATEEPETEPETSHEGEPELGLSDEVFGDAADGGSANGAGAEAEAEAEADSKV
jgi:small subunit ribosomal protein S1